MSYVPSKELLEKYADVLVNFALGSGNGIKEGEVVWMRLHEAAKPFYAPLRNTILKAGGIPLIEYIADDVDLADYYNLATEKQIGYFMEPYHKGLIDQADHFLYILSETNKYELQAVDPKKVILAINTRKQFMQWRNAKEAAGKFTWTIALYGTPHMAEDVGLTETEYWQEIITACYLDKADPIAEWKHTYTELNRIQEALNSLSIEKLHLEAEDIDLTVGIGPNRLWLGGGGRNIPSFELFISPDWRQTEGEIRFNQPVYRYGNCMEGIYLRFKEGLIVESGANKGEAFLQEMIATENADKIGEFSLTDSRFSNITKVMGETLYDENMGGEQGNTHIAVGNAYQDSFPGDASNVTEAEWKAWGYNQSAEHTDIISTAKRTVTALLSDGSKKIIYTDGRFTV